MRSGACFPALLFVILSKYEDRPFIRNLDFAVTVKVQEKIDRSAHLRLASFVDTMMTGTTFFASPEFTSAVVIILTGLALYDRKKKVGMVRLLLFSLVSLLSFLLSCMENLLFIIHLRRFL